MRARIVRGRASSGARELSRASGIKTSKLVRTKFRPRPSDVLINWGCSTETYPFDPSVGTVLNSPDAVSKASNKRNSLMIFRDAGVPRPEFTTEPETATEWWKDGHAVVCRTVLTGSAGAGIILVTPDDPYRDQMPEARLYTKYFKGYREYRVHVFQGIVIDVQQKRVRNGVEEPNYYVRSYNNGWVFCREGLELPDCVAEAAKAAVEALGLSFGAADVKYNEHHDSAVVLEVNTAPGLVGSTVDAYAAQLRLFLED